MTISEIRALADWPKTLRSRSVHGVLANGLTLRIIGVGRSLVKLMHADGRIIRVYPSEITEIRGL